MQMLGPNPLFNFYSSPDLHNANQVIAYIDQGGLSLPDRDYYLKDDPRWWPRARAWWSMPPSCSR